MSPATSPAPVSQPAIVSLKNSLRANIDRLRGFDKRLAEGILQTTDRTGWISERQGEQIMRLERVARTGQPDKASWTPRPIEGETPLQTYRRRKAEIARNKYRWIVNHNGNERHSPESQRQSDYASAEHDYKYATDSAYALDFDTQKLAEEKRSEAFFDRAFARQERQLRRAIISGWSPDVRKKRLRAAFDWMPEPEKEPRARLLADLRRDLRLAERGLAASKAHPEPVEIQNVIAGRIVRLRICLAAERLALWRDLKQARRLQETE